MKVTQIFVANGSTGLKFTSGCFGVAVFPVEKGKSHSLVLLNTGKVVRMPGARINGVGVPRYLTDIGFTLASKGHPDAEILARHVEEVKGLELVETASHEMAVALQKEFAGRALTQIPFDADKPVTTGIVSARTGMCAIAFDLQDGFSAGCVSLEFDAKGYAPMDFQVGKGWLVDGSTELPDLPRSTPFGGVIETAAYALCSVGLTSLAGPEHIQMDSQVELDDAFARGKLTLQVKGTTDYLVVGATADDLVRAAYVRGGDAEAEELVARTMATDGKFGPVAGFFAGLLVHVKDLDAAASKKAPRKRAA